MVAVSPSSRTSLLADLILALPHLHPQLYFKSSLVALSHAMEDQVLYGHGQPLVFANFQRERYYRQEARRYERISQIARQVYVLAAPETDFLRQTVPYKTVPLDLEDPLTQEWHLIIVDDAYATCLVCRERFHKPSEDTWFGQSLDPARQFEGIWSFEQETVIQAAQALIPKIRGYRPDLDPLLQDAERYLQQRSQPSGSVSVNPALFAERLITYLQAGQYKLQRTYKAIHLQEIKERSLNQIMLAMRRSLDPGEILQIAVRELGMISKMSRCLIYRCSVGQREVTIEQEYCREGVVSLRSQPWSLEKNPFLLTAIKTGDLICAQDTTTDVRLAAIQDLCQRAQIRSWLVIPLLYQGRLLGILELHNDTPTSWPPLVLELGTSLASQIGIALIQAEAYQHLDDLNQQLAALDQAKTDLIAVTGHELRTPLSTIQICLESLASDPDMPMESRQEMLDTALQDAFRLRRLVQDFLTLSKLESGRVQWRIEPVSAEECLDLSMSSIQARRRHEKLPQIVVDIAPNLPLLQADGEWLVEALRKLLDNACKFTPATGQIWLRLLPIEQCVFVDPSDPSHNGHGRATSAVQFTIRDSGRGIDPSRLQVIFERFYQVEGALRRSVGGTGLGLTICRLIIEAMGGRLWAESAGENKGSAFHFTIPTAPLQQDPHLHGLS
jgi:DICT domain-containing protein/signal transduction histidine kinase